jgi:Ser/Thr protein kinase RdoA (MazF antagonist)
MPQPFLPPSLASEAERILTLFPQVATQVSLQLNAAGQRAVPTHPVIRDVWHDHLLFTGDAVTGLIDFGAMRNDSIAVDVSRLLGSLVGDDIQGWKHGLGAYQQIRPLSRAEDELIGTLDSSTILLSGLNWLRWIYVDRRRFDDFAQVAGRLREIAGRLEGLAARSGRPIVQRCGTSSL